MRRDARKHQKEKERQKKVAESARHAADREAMRRRRNQYPRVLFDEAGGDPDFVKAIRSAVASIDFDAPDFCSPWIREVYRRIRSSGWETAKEWLAEISSQLSSENYGRAKILELEFICHFGHTIFSRIPPSKLEQFFPYNDVLVLFVRHAIVLQFSSMLSQKGTGGKIYYSQRKPTVEFSGRAWTVGFSRHAIEQICRRLNPRYQMYVAAGDIHAFFSKCVYFEPVFLNDGQPAFCMYERCDNPTFVTYERYVKSVLGEGNLDRELGRCYYRVGYCPVAFEEPFAKAVTFLYPGFTNTPEFGLLRGAAIPEDKRHRLMNEARSNDATEVLENGSLDAIRWFHNNGLPQVIQTSRTVFVHDESKRIVAAGLRRFLGPT